MDAVLRRRGRHGVGPRLGQGPDRGPKTGCPDTFAKEIGVFALPGSDGQPAPVLLGGSDIAIAAKSANQDLAQKAVALMLSDDYQTIMAKAGLTPAMDSLAPLLGDDEFAAATIEAASNAKLTPAAPGWANVEGSRVLEDLFSAIAQGGDVAELAAKADEQMNVAAQRLTRARRHDVRQQDGRGGASRRPGRAMPGIMDLTRDDQTGEDQDDGTDVETEPPAAAAPQPLPYVLLRPRRRSRSPGARLPAGAPARAVLPGVRPGPAVRPPAGVGRGSTTTAS